MFPEFLAAVPLIMHGLANLTGFMVSWTAGEFGYANRPWVLSSSVTLKSPLGHIFGLLWLLTTLSLVAAGVGVFTHAAWWRWAAVGGAALSLLVILLWLRTVPPGAYFGALFDLLVIAALALPWGEAVTRWLRVP